jgi:hypothetical protein
MEFFPGRKVFRKSLPAYLVSTLWKPSKLYRIDRSSPTATDISSNGSNPRERLLTPHRTGRSRADTPSLKLPAAKMSRGLDEGQHRLKAPLASKSFRAIGLFEALAASDCRARMSQFIRRLKHSL